MNDSKTTPFALDLTVLITLGAALIYVMGWSYAYHWYDRFNLGILGLEIPLEYFMMYGFWSLRHAWWLVFIYAVAVGVWMFTQRLVRPWLWRIAPVGLLLIFWLAYALGEQAAYADYTAHQGNQLACYPLVRLGIKQEAGRAKQMDELAGQLVERDYRLLLQTKNLLVVIKPKVLTAPVAVIIPLSSVDILRLTPVNPGCHK